MKNQEQDHQLPSIFLFDIGNVLTRSDQGITFQLLIESQNISYELATTVFTNPAYKLYSQGKITDEEYTAAIQVALRLPQLTMDEIRTFHDQHIYEVDTDMIEVIHTLENFNYKIAYVTDTNVWQTERQETMLQAAGVTISQIFRSHDLGVNKADQIDPSFFSKVLTSLGTDANNCILIDDSQVNLEAARRHGIKSIGFISVEQLQSEFRRLHILRP